MDDVKNVITDEQAEAIYQELDEAYNGTDMDNIPRDDEPLEDKKKVYNTMIDPDTGKKQILEAVKDEDADLSFKEKAIKTINTIDFDIDKSMSEGVTAEEFSEMIIEDGTFLKELTNGTDLTEDDIKGILSITNRVIKKEDIDNLYKELPETVQKMVDNYIISEFKALPIARMNLMRKSVTSSLINRYIQLIQLRRSKYDFAHALANLYDTEEAKEIENAVMDAHIERNKVYREIAEEIEDPEKKKRMLDILDQIDEAKNLTNLKEFAKKCRIKSIDIEKPKKAFTDFLNKYKDSTNNIYDISTAYKAMLRNINTEESDYDEKDVAAFYVLFCKQVQKYDESNPLEHAYMYYVLYYSVMSDAEQDSEFIANVKEVIDNIKQRNPDRFKK